MAAFRTSPDPATQAPRPKSVRRPVSSQREQRFTWKTLNTLESIEGIARRWNKLAHREALSPTSDAIWHRCALGAFSELRDNLAIHCLYAGEDLLAVVPLRRRARLVRVWAGVQNVHWPFWTFAVDGSRRGAIREVLNHLLETAECIDLPRVHFQEFPFDALRAEAEALGCAVALAAPDEDVYLSILADFDQTRLALPPKMRREASRKTRRLERFGALRHERVACGPSLQHELEECFRIEQIGWKGASGSPIASDPETHRFYTALARDSAAAGRFALDLLRLDGRIIAYEISIRAQGRIDMLKPSFDPEYARYSPGNVLRLKILAHESESGEIQTYHLGRPSEWKRHWVRNAKPLCRVRIYRSGWRGRAAYLVGPWVRGVAKRAAGALGLRR